MKTIAQEWKRFYTEVVKPLRPGAVQIQETRRGFYAGAWAALSLMLELSEDSVSEEAGVNAIEALRIECLEFTRHVGTPAEERESDAHPR